MRMANAIITLVDVDFECPKCQCPHSEKDWFERFSKSKTGLIYISCTGCKAKLGVTTDIRGDVRVWLKETEKQIKR